MDNGIEQVAEVRARIVRTARSMLGGECSYIEGSRVICGLLHSADLEYLEEPFVVFVGVESETDDVPVRSARALWRPAGAELEKKWADAERYAQTYLEPACHDAIAWLTAHPR